MVDEFLIIACQLNEVLVLMLSAFNRSRTVSGAALLDLSKLSCASRPGIVSGKSCR